MARVPKLVSCSSMSAHDLHCCTGPVVFWLMACNGSSTKRKSVASLQGGMSNLCSRQPGRAGSAHTQGAQL